MSACPRPVDVPAIVDYWMGDLPAAEAEALEEHLFDCDACFAATERAVRVMDRVRAATQAGRLPPVVLSRSALELLEANGVPVRRYVAEPGGVVPCQASPHRYAVMHLRGDFRGVERVDLAIEASDGWRGRAEGLPVDPDAGEVVVAWPGDVIRAAPDRTVWLTLYGRDDLGERVLARYTLEHSATLAD